MKNFLFLSIDDLNDWTAGLGGYSGTVHTPNLDRLMAQGTTFTNAFSQAAICNPSRASVLTGKEPQETGIFNNQQYNWEAMTPPQDTIFGYLRGAGYHSEGLGKLFHTGASLAATQAMFDRYQYMGKDSFPVDLDGKPIGPYDGTETLADARRADYVVEYLTNHLPDPQTPLMLSVGLMKPHLDWIVPREFFDLYPIDEIRIDAVPNDLDDIPSFALDIWSYDWGQNDVPDEATWKQLIQAYLATISFMDAQVGKILDALDASAIADTTAVVLWSDHGYHLGDKDTWHKFTLWDNAARAPLIIRDPGVVPAAEIVSDPVELLDIFPTMLDMAGLPQGDLALSGKSLTPYFNGSAPEGPAQAFTWMYGNVSIRTNDYRYTLYEDGSVEFYHIPSDPELTTNLAGHPALAGAEADLRAALVAKFHLVGYGAAGATLQGSEADNVFADVHGVVLEGGKGNDVYFAAPGSRIVEQAEGGRDLILTKAETYRLPDHVEDLEILFWANTVHGNGAGNIITADAWRIYAEAGDDTIQAGGRPGFYDLGAGDDQIFGAGGNDTILGGSGNDWINGNTDQDSLRGEAGDDTLYGGTGTDTLEGGDGDDHLDGQAQNDTLWGGAGQDRLAGGNDDDLLSGNDGADILHGDRGDDWLFGGTGDDVLRGGAGNDRLFGGAHNDTLVGELGNDTLIGEWGNDELLGHGGDDSLQGNQNNDILFGQDGRDTLLGGHGLDTLYGGAGTDAMNGGGNEDLLYGEDGDDFMYGASGFDTLIGGAGHDRIEGGEHADNLYGGTQNDTLIGGRGFDRLFGQDGDDQGFGGTGDDAVFGQNGRDTLDGGDGDDRLFGGRDNDVLWGQSGNDSLQGNGQEDRLYGGDGNDWLNGGTGFDTLDGGAGADFLYGGDHADNLYGGAGNDRMLGGDGLDRLFGGDGNDDAYGGNGRDAIFGQDGDDTLFGQDGNDSLDGGAGDDLLHGGAGADHLSGGAGFDTLIATTGRDTLAGGFNADVFVFNDLAFSGGGGVITDFDAHSDFEVIDLRAVTSIPDFADLHAHHIAQMGRDVHIDDGAGNVLTLQNVDLADVLAGRDFLF